MVLMCEEYHHTINSVYDGTRVWRVPLCNQLLVWWFSCVKSTIIKSTPCMMVLVCEEYHHTINFLYDGTRVWRGPHPVPTQNTRTTHMRTCRTTRLLRLNKWFHILPSFLFLRVTCSLPVNWLDVPMMFILRCNVPRQLHRRLRTHDVISMCDLCLNYLSSLAFKRTNTPTMST